MREGPSTLGNNIDVDSGGRFTFPALHTKPVDQRSRATKDAFDLAVGGECEPVTGRPGDQRMLLIRKAVRDTRLVFGHDHHKVEIGARHLDFAHDYVLLLRAHRSKPND